MKPPAFDYARPASADEALGLLQEHGSDAKVLAGGQSLVPLMNFRLARPAVLIDINRLEELSYIREADGNLVLGALTRQSAVEDSALVAERCPLLLEATRWLGHRTIRNRGTVGGSVAHADPSAEYPTVLCALDGEVVVRGSSGERVVPAAELFQSICTTSLAPDELLTEVRVPTLPPRTGWAFVELSRRHGDFAQVGVAAMIRPGAGGQVDEVRLALAGVGETPLRCHQAEAALRGRQPDDQAVGDAAAACAAVADPQDDIHATAAYKKAMVEVFVARALRKALGRVRSA